MSKLFLLLSFVLAYSVVGVQVVLAAQYEPLIELPEFVGSLDAEGFIRTLYIIAIGVAAFVAVGRLVLAGFTYVTSSVVTDKSDAKKDITNAILGLIIILAATTILTTINPSISNLPALTALDLPPASPVVVVGGNEDTQEYWCEQYGEGNCSTIDCNILESSLWSLAAWGGANSINSAVCEGRCLYFGGEVVEEGDKCVYPTDSATYKEKRLEAETAELATELDQTIPDGVYVQECTAQGGPVQCQQEEEACTSGNLLPSGERGSATNTTTNEGRRVVICTSPSTTSGDAANEASDTILYNGQAVNTSITYTINDPATAELSEGEYHNRTGTIIAGESESGLVNHFIIQLDDGTEVNIPCGLIQPRIPGC